MTDLVPHQPTDTDTLVPLSRSSELIRQTAQDLADAHRIASALVATAFAPAHFRGKPDEGAAAILYGATIDMDPLTALQNLYVIGGKPALYARAMVAVVMSKGHRIWTEHEDEGTVTVAGQRKGTDAVERVTWTTEMAKRAGYTNNKKYQTDPRSMLYARASGDVARRIAPDALLGMAHNVEELTIDPTAGAAEPAPTQRHVSAADFTQPKPDTPRLAPEPVEPDKWTDVEKPTDVTHLPEAPDAPASAGTAPEAADTEPEVPMITTAQTRKMAAQMREAGLSEKADALAYVGGQIGREIQSRNELTKAEASKVIDALETRLNPQPATDAEVVEAELDPWGETA